MSKVVISDTSCFIILSKINELELLHKVYENILITPEIVAEYGETLPEWIEIVSVQDKYKQQLFEMQLGKGESSAMALSLEIPDSQRNWNNMHLKKPESCNSFQKHKIQQFC